MSIRLRFVLSTANCTSILIQQNVDGSTFFHRSWAEYKAGFGSREGNYWHGNDRLHQLTKSGRYKLRIDLQQRYTGDWFWVEHDAFIVEGEEEDYRLTLGTFSGNTGNMLRHLSNGGRFSTYDRNNYRYSNSAYNNSCPLLVLGGFWYRGCGYALLNGAFPYFYWFGLPEGNSRLKTCRMSLLCLQ